MTYWIFQSNPRNFLIDEYIRDNKLVEWSIRQKNVLPDISTGDVVFIWRSNGHKRDTGGIIARGTIVGKPKRKTPDQSQYWLNAKGLEPIERAAIEIGEFRLTPEDGMILRSELLENQRLKDLQILTFSRKTNYPINSGHAKQLENIWANQPLR